MSDARAPALVEELLAAPVGVAVLARLEADHRPDLAWYEAPVDSDHGAVQRAAAWVRAKGFGELMARTLYVAESLAGPWVPGAPVSLARCFRLAGERRPIAEAIVSEHLELLDAPCDAEAQQWWLGAEVADIRPPRRLFVAFDHVYGNGEFTWAGLRTVTDPPPELHAELVIAWELHPGPISRWRLPVRELARVWEIRSVRDWARLVETYPRTARVPHEGWELPGPNQHPEALQGLLAVPGQSAARVRTGGHLLPDWAAVAEEWDGVHLTWAGFLTSEGRVWDLEGGAVTMLRYWASERTLWLADVFGEPEPSAPPMLRPDTGSDGGIDVRIQSGRRRQDAAFITAQLGR